ncbi:MAG TPA: AEC family transporter [Thermodesulfobacteriota bacterium]|nr:AEC family transporter [Thermodesulfobacteriota bacterium]
MVFLNVVLPVFLIVGLGFFIRRIGFVDKLFLERISLLAYFVAVPALLIWKIGTASFSINFNPRLILGSYIAVIGCGVAAYLTARIFRLPPKEVGSFTQGSFWGNMTYIGLPILLAAYGEAGLQRGGVLIGFLTPLVNAAAVLALTLPLRGVLDWKSVIDLRNSLVTNPIILSCAAGLLLSRFSVPFPEFLVNFLRFLSDLALPLALIAMGGNLSFEKIRKDYRATALATAFKLFLIVVWGWFLFRQLGVTGMDFQVGIILLACPTALSSYLLSTKLGADRSLMSSDIMVSTLLSMATLSFWLWKVG